MVNQTEIHVFVVSVWAHGALSASQRCHACLPLRPSVLDVRLEPNAHLRPMQLPRSLDVLCDTHHCAAGVLHVDGEHRYRTMPTEMRYSTGLLSHLAVAENDEFLTREFFQTHGTTCVNTRRANTHFST